MSKVDGTLYLSNRLSGEIISHDGYPNTTYSQDIDTNVTFLGLNSSHVLTLVFDTFDLYYNPEFKNCESDWLEFGGIVAQGWRLKLCGFPVSKPATNIFYRFPVSGRSISFRFHTNFLNTAGLGFKLRFYISKFTSAPITLH